jgi:hypothetical protein
MSETSATGTASATVTGLGAGRFPPGHPYRHRTAAVATKHDKTHVLARALGGYGGLVLQAATVDTDAFGTFTGDVARTAGPVATSIAKARAGIEASGHPLGLASEGSFGPHRVVGLVTVQQEVVTLVDAATGLVVTGHGEAPAPWAVTRHLAPDEPVPPDLRETRQVLVARPHDPLPGHSRQGISKGITTAAALSRAVRRAAAWSATGTAVVETDLRAHVCHRRRRVLAAAAADLAGRLARRCEACGSPGSGHVETVLGAPCAWCRRPTDAPLATVTGCPACGHRVRTDVPGAEPADPGRCQGCNP